MKRLLGALAALCLLFAAPARAYEEDTHFTMTLVLCRAVGLTDAEALTVASYDQGMDDSEGTIANTGIIPHVKEEMFWHAIPNSGTKDEVFGRKNHLWNQVRTEADPSRRLQRLGTFFHYQQDTWAHRYHLNSDSKNFQPFRTPLGHAAFGHQPDRPPYDPLCALRCLEEGISYARQFLQVLDRTPNKLFDNYTPATSKIDDQWTDTRKGKFFNTLTIDDSTPAHKFLTELIRSQIDAYTVSRDSNPNFIQRDTADEVVYSVCRTKLQNTCNQAGLNISIPVGYTHVVHLTTEDLLKPGPAQPAPAKPTPVQPAPVKPAPVQPTLRDYTVRIYTGDTSGAGTDSNIFLAIQGTRIGLAELRLNGLISGDAFERNQTDTVILRNQPPIGELRSITVRSDDKYTASAWFLGWIEISSPGITTRRFDFNAWLQSPNLTSTMSVSSSAAVAQTKIKLKSASNGQYLCASDGLQHDKWLYCKPGTTVRDKQFAS